VNTFASVLSVLLSMLAVPSPVIDKGKSANGVSSYAISLNGQLTEYASQKNTVMRRLHLVGADGSYPTYTLGDGDNLNLKRIKEFANPEVSKRFLAARHLFSGIGRLETRRDPRCVNSPCMWGTAFSVGENGEFLTAYHVVARLYLDDKNGSTWHLREGRKPHLSFGMSKEVHGERRNAIPLRASNLQVLRADSRLDLALLRITPAPSLSKFPILKQNKCRGTAVVIGYPSEENSMRATASAFKEAKSDQIRYGSYRLSPGKFRGAGGCNGQIETMTSLARGSSGSPVIAIGNSNIGVFGMHYCHAREQNYAIGSDEIASFLSEHQQDSHFESTPNTRCAAIAK